MFNVCGIMPVISMSQSALKLLSSSDVQGTSDSKLKCYSCGCMYSGSWICWADDGHNQKTRNLVRIAVSILHLSSQYLERWLQTCRNVIVLGGEEFSSIIMDCPLSENTVWRRIGFCERLLGCLGRIYSGNPNYVKQVESEYEMDELSSCKQAWDQRQQKTRFCSCWFGPDCHLRRWYCRGCAMPNRKGHCNLSYVY